MTPAWRFGVLVGAARTEAKNLANQATILMHKQEYQEAESLFERSLEIYRDDQVEELLIKARSHSEESHQ